jgi:hypothetical protein
MTADTACDFVFVAPLILWAAVGVFISSELMTHGKDGAPWFFAQWNADSYTSEGQRWLLRLKRWLVGLPISLVLGVALYWAFCDRPAGGGTAAREETAPRLQHFDFTTWLIVFAYGAIGFVILWQLVSKRSRQHDLSMRRLLASSSYSADGQAWLTAFRIWLVGNVLLVVGLLLVRIPR